MNKKRSKGRRLSETKTSLARRGIQIYLTTKRTRKTEKNKGKVKKSQIATVLLSFSSFLGLKLSYVSYYVLQITNIQRQFYFEASPFFTSPDSLLLY